MKDIFKSGVIAVLIFVSCSGCMSMSTIHAAKRDASGSEPAEGGVPRPGYLLLLPLAVPADGATLPFQGIAYLMFRNVDNGR